MRKAVAIIMAGALSAGILAPTALADEGKHESGKSHTRFEAEYKDWQQSFWANESLARMITLGVIKGNGDGTIATLRPVTRLEAAIMVTRLLQLKPIAIPQGEFEVKAPWGKIEIENKNDKFELQIKSKDGDFKLEDSSKVPTWGRDAVLTALQNGFLIYDGASLNPMKPLTRLEAAVMMVKAAGLDADAQAKTGAELSFKDADKVPAKLAGYIAIAVEKGFVTGYEDGTFQPAKTLTRAEWAALLDRLDRQGPAVSADGRQVKGTVTAVATGSSPSISMNTPVYPDGVTYAIDDSAVFYKNGQEITLADLNAQDNVILNLNADRQVLMVTVVNVVRQVNGQVTGFVAPATNVPGSISLSTQSVTTTYVVPVSATVTLAGAPATAADVLVGDKVTLTLEGAHLTKIAIKAEPVSLAATLSAVTSGTNSVRPTLEVTGSDNVATTYDVADFATIKAAGGAALTLADLETGDKLTLTVERNLVTAITVKAAAQ
jgi:hypothetical protein